MVVSEIVLLKKKKKEKQINGKNVLSQCGNAELQI